MKRVLIACLGALLLSGPCLAAQEVELKDEMDRINYSIGHQVGADFQRQEWKLKSEIMVRGMMDAVERKTPLMTTEQMNATLRNLKKNLMVDQQRKAREEDKAFLEANAKKEGVVVLPDGVQYKVIKEGSGKKPALEDTVAIRSRVSRPGDKETKRDYSTAKPKTYPLKKALPGLREVLQLMKEGSVWQIVLPPGPAMGIQGETLANAGVLVYELELVSVNKVSSVDAAP